MYAAIGKTGFTAEIAEIAEASILSPFLSVETRCDWSRCREDVLQALPTSLVYSAACKPFLLFAFSAHSAVSN